MNLLNVAFFLLVADLNVWLLAIIGPELPAGAGRGEAGGGPGTWNSSLSRNL